MVEKRDKHTRCSLTSTMAEEISKGSGQETSTLRGEHEGSSPAMRDGLLIKREAFDSAQARNGGSLNVGAMLLIWMDLLVLLETLL